MIEQKVSFHTNAQGHVMLGREMNTFIAEQNKDGWFVTHLAVDSINGALLASVLFQRGEIETVVVTVPPKKQEGFNI